jgi:hypothetical protein
MSDGPGPSPGAPAGNFSHRRSPATTPGREALRIGGAVPDGAAAAEGTRRPVRKLGLAARACDALGSEALGYFAIVVDAAVDEAKVAVGKVRPQSAPPDAEPLRRPATCDVADGHQVVRGSMGTPSPLVGRGRRCGLATDGRCERRRRRGQRPTQHSTPRSACTQISDDPVECVAFHRSPFLCLLASRPVVKPLRSLPGHRAVSRCRAECTSPCRLGTRNRRRMPHPR